MLQPKYKSNQINQQCVVILVGDVRVGKTSFLYSATGKSQNNIQPTMGIDFITTNLIFRGKPIKIQIWDTTGAQTYRSITSTYYKKAQGVILMFDINNKSTFQNVKRWNHQVDQKANYSISKILIGNKVDLVDRQSEREISQEEITNFCIDNHMTYKQTSALKGINVKQALIEIIQKIYESRNDTHPANQYTSILQANPNTTILVEPPVVSQPQNGSCAKCC